MKNLVLLLVTLGLSLCFAFARELTANAQENNRKHNLLPSPSSVQFSDDRLVIDSSFKIATRGHSDARLQSGIARFVKRLEGRTVLSFAPGLAVDDQTTTLVIQCDGAGKDI